MKKFFLNLILLLACACACHAQGSENPASRTDSHANAQQPAQTPTPPARQASQPAPVGTPPELAEANRLSSEVVKLYQARKYDEALPLAQRVLALREKIVGPSDLIVGVALNNLGVLYREKKKYEEAAQQFRRSLSIFEKYYGADSTQVSDVLAMLAVTAYGKGDLDEAPRLAERSLTLREKALGSEHEKVADSVYLLAQLYRARKEVERASDLFKRAIVIWKKKGTEFDALIEEAQENHVCMAYDYLFRFIVRGKKEEVEELRAKLFGKENEKLNPFSSHDGNVVNGKSISKPQPDYPMSAKRERLSGPVVIRIKVDETGKVTEAYPLCGRRDVLAGAARQAALRARFTPTTKDGQPVKVSGYINYNFYLQP